MPGKVREDSLVAGVGNRSLKPHRDISNGASYEVSLGLVPLYATADIGTDGRRQELLGNVYQYTVTA